MDNESNKNNCSCSNCFWCASGGWGRNILIVLGAVLSLFLLVTAINGIKAFGYIGKNPNADKTITFTGKGEVFAVPDVATFSFGVTKEASTVSEAQGKTTETMNGAIDAVKKLGVDEKDIKTVDYSVYPNYEYQTVYCRSGVVCPPANQVLKGYSVSQTVSVKVRNVADAGKILGAVGELGITNASGLSFTVDDQEKVLRDARQAAIADAKSQAEALSKDLGVSLGDIVGFSESNGYMPYNSYDSMTSGKGVSMMSPTPEVLPGQNKITEQVNVTYQFK